MFCRMNTRIVLIGAAMAALGALVGCRGDRTDERPRQFFPSLDDQPKFEPQAESQMFADGRTMREPPAGVVAFGRMPYEVAGAGASGGAGAALGYGSTADERKRAQRLVRVERSQLLREDVALATGQNVDGSYLERMPVRQLLGYEPGEPIPQAVMTDFLKLGETKYSIFCYTCHGAVGDGKGPVGLQWSGAGPASLLQERLLPGGENGQDGYMFSIGYFGLANTPGAEPALRMPAYGSQLTEYEMWAVTAYIRALQRSQNADLEDVPAAERERLLRNRPASSSSGQAGQMGGQG